jgi:hypothetical protein
MEEGNKLERLQKQVEDLEKKVQELPEKDFIIRELETRLAAYESEMGSDKGKIILKKNAYIKNRKGLFDWAENVLALGFNKTDPSKLNQIQIGVDRDDGTKETMRETNTVFIQAKKNEDAKLERESDEVKSANGSVLITTNKGEDHGGFTCGERIDVVGDKDGVVAAVYGSKAGGLAGIGNLIDLNGTDILAVSFHTEEDTEDGGVYQQHIKQFVDILPSSDGGIVPALGRSGYPYKELVLKSPNNSSWAVRVDDSGNLTATEI